MNDEWAGVAERMVKEFVHLPRTMVVETVCSCADECEFASPLFLEQAVRASLAERPASAPGGRRRRAPA